MNLQSVGLTRNRAFQHGLSDLILIIKTDPIQEIKRKGKKYVVNGGRVFHLIAEGSDIFQAREKAYKAMSQIYIQGNSLHYRTDIGWREVERHI